MNINGTIGDKYQSALVTRPYDFGTDAIERQRVSLGQSLIDADFEYGLQSTKWQAYSEIRKTPSFYETPGTDLTISAITSNGATPSVMTVTYTPNVTIASVSGSPGATSTTFQFTVSSTTGITVGMYVFGTSMTGAVTVKSIDSATTFTVQYSSQSPTTMSNVTLYFLIWLPATGGIINVYGLGNADFTYKRAEEFAIITTATPASNQFTYQARGLVAAGSVYQSYTGIRRGSIYNNSNAKIQVNTINYNTSGLVTVTTFERCGLLGGMPIVVTGSSIAQCNGNFFITNVVNNTFYYAAAAGGSTGTATGASIYILPFSYVNHRPYDGGVLLSPNIATYGASITRQSKKVFRYQSGKGLLFSSGTLFCPNNDITALTSTGLSVGSTITVTTDVPHGAPQAGATVQIRNVTTSGYNGSYIINTVLGDTQFTVLATQTLGATTAVLGDQPRFVMSKWSGACVRAGCFDDQNGVFWEWDGQTLWVVKRSSTFQISGLVYTNTSSAGPATGTQTLVGSLTRFQDQLTVGDRITFRGMTHTVTGISSQTSLTFTPPYRGASSISSAAPVKACKIKELRVPQNQFNRDTIDGTGPSGYKVDLTKMQMIGIQYSWYGAGFIDFMIRGGDGNWVYVHRFRNNNTNDEAYMRTGNMPVRYEVTNETVVATSTLATPLDTTTPATLVINDTTTYWPDKGVLLVDDEFISYTGKTSNGFTGLTRSATLSYNVIDTLQNFTGQSTVSHSSGAPVNLISCTCSPSLTHWGSAFLMDGMFDTDRGYFFNYQINSVSAIPTGTTLPLFLLRLSPTVSNGITGDIGTRDLLNRAQLLLQRLDVFCGSTNAQTSGSGSTGSMVISGILNPSFINPASWVWTSINTPALGSQPSFAQVATNLSGSTYIVGTGERVFSTISNNGQNTLDLSNLKEICNGVIGGNQFFPDGPDTLLVYIQVPTGFPALASYSLNLFWTEAQA